jgi:hypothetical protein
LFANVLSFEQQSRDNNELVEALRNKSFIRQVTLRGLYLDKCEMETIESAFDAQTTSAS